MLHQEAQPRNGTKNGDSVRDSAAIAIELQPGLSALLRVITVFGRRHVDINSLS